MNRGIIISAAILSAVVVGVSGLAILDRPATDSSHDSLSQQIRDLNNSHAQLEDEVAGMREEIANFGRALKFLRRNQQDSLAQLGKSESDEARRTESIEAIDEVVATLEDRLAEVEESQSMRQTPGGLIQSIRNAAAAHH